MQLNARSDFDVVEALQFLQVHVYVRFRGLGLGHGIGYGMATAAVLPAIADRDDCVFKTRSSSSLAEWCGDF